MKKVQYFRFYPTQIEASEIQNHLQVDFSEEWDFALESFNGVETAYRVNGYRHWATLKTGSNPWGLVFMEPGDHNYEDSSSTFSELRN